MRIFFMISMICAKKYLGNFAGIMRIWMKMIWAMLKICRREHSVLSMNL